MMQPELIRLSIPRRTPQPEPKPPPPLPRPAADTFPALLEVLSSLEPHLKDPAAGAGLGGSAWKVLKALSHRPALASALARELDLDQAHLSRIVKRLEAKTLIERTTAKDRRQTPLSLTREGRTLLRRAEAEWRESLRRLLKRGGPASEARLAEALALLHDHLVPKAAAEPKQPSPETAYRLRILKRGDLTLLAHRRVMAESEADEAAILAGTTSYLSDYDRRRDIGWIAENNGRLAGACLLKGGNEGSAELAMLHVEPEAAGSGLAENLIENCLAFAEVAKYEGVTACVHGSHQEHELALAENGFRLLRSKIGEEVRDGERTWFRRF